MGNSLGCSASGERLISAARDGDLVEAKMLLDFNPCLAKYSTFAALNSPLHFAAAKGHNDIVALLLENGADVNLRNYCGQTALMQACRYGHWEVVQTLILFRSNVTRTDYLNGRTALHFAASEGHVRCVRLVVADFVSGASFFSSSPPGIGSSGHGGSYSSDHQYNQIALSKFVNKSADGGLTALHMAALNRHFECVELLLDLNANVSAFTLRYGSAMDLIGAGSTPLHYAAYGGNLKCCQILLAKGASRRTLNCNGWLPMDVARIWGRHWLEPLLSPISNLTLPPFLQSNHLSLPLTSILNIAREYGLQSSTVPSDDNDFCVVCLERSCTVAAEVCGHELCTKCALCLCSSSTSIPTTDVTVRPGLIPCPLCRQGIVSFVKLPCTPTKEIKLKLAPSLCNPCVLSSRDTDPPTAPSCGFDINENHTTSDSSFTCDDDPCGSLEPEGETPASSLISPQMALMEHDR